MKTIISKSSLLAILLTITISASAFDCEVNGIYYNLNDKTNTASVTFNNKEKKLKYEGDVSIPQTTVFNGKSYLVTEIEKEAFYKCTKLTSVTIGENVRSIGNSAFEGCKELRTVNFPTKLEQIGSKAFKGCSKLASVTIPDSVKVINSQTFRDCTGLITVNLPKDLEEIKDMAFFGCVNMKEPMLGGKIRHLGYDIFGNIKWNEDRAKNSSAAMRDFAKAKSVEEMAKAMLKNTEEGGTSTVIFGNAIPEQIRREAEQAKRVKEARKKTEKNNKKK